MDNTNDSPPPYMIRAAELYPKDPIEKEDAQLNIPYQELAGEAVKYLGRTDDGVLALSNYRIFLLKKSTNEEISIPLGLIESMQSRDLFHLIIYCKDASTVKCSFETAEQCSEWLRRLQLSIGVPDALESIFAFPFCSWACDMLADVGQNTSNQNDIAATFFFNSNNNTNGISYGGNCWGSELVPSPCWLPSFNSIGECTERFQRAASRYEDDFLAEVKRLGFDLNGPWRISQANIDFKLCPSYPPKLLVPCCISDDTLSNVANFRGSRRLPVVVWRHRKSGAVIARCSQPEVGWLGWRNTKDEQLLKALADACAFDRGEQLRLITSSAVQYRLNNGQSNTLHNNTTINEINAKNINANDGNSAPSSPECSHEEVAMDEVRKILIVDARSYTSAVTNRARGGGCECIEYYPCAEIEFMNLSNIHAIRKSFHALRQLCASPPDVPNWLGLLEKTMWLQHLSGLLAASMTVCHAIEKKGRPVLVHCSDGWDRTPQIVATAQLCLDPFYRTVDGFRILVEREWLSYGHKFADRCGHGPNSDELNERCPIFLQWLDLVHQIHRQFSCSFEFSMAYLIKLTQHSHSGLFGTFLCNTLKERTENSVFERTFSVWPFLSGPMYRNPLYVPNKDKVLWPAYNVRDLTLWTEVYLGSLGGNQNTINLNAHIQCDSFINSTGGSMPKTRSYGDLINAGVITNGISRRSSDPNMLVEPNLANGTQFGNKSITNLEYDDDCTDSPNSLTTFIYDATKQLSNLTNDLKNEKEKDTKIINSSSQQETVDEMNVSTSSFDTDVCNKANDCQTPKMNGILHNSLVPFTVLKPDSNTECYNKDNCSVEQFTSSIMPKVSKDTICETHGINMTSSIELEEKSLNGVFVEPQDIYCKEILGRTQFSNSNHLQADPTLNLWHGSVTNSTDTLVPIQPMTTVFDSTTALCNEIDHSTNTNCELKDENAFNDQKSVESEIVDTHEVVNINSQTPKEDILAPRKNSLGGIVNVMSSSSSVNDVIPEVHSINRSRVNSKPFMNNSLVNGNEISEIVKELKINDSSTKIEDCSNNVGYLPENDDRTNMNSKKMTTLDSNMEENKIILPEHQKLEISISGQYETITPSSVYGSDNIPITTTVASTIDNLPCSQINSLASKSSMCPTSSPSTSYLKSMPINAVKTQRHRRTLSSNSRRDGGGSFAGALTNRTHNFMTRFSLPNGNGSLCGEGVRSLPMTPPGQLERAAIAISCPDGLAHALSEENIRLQQIVHEHKLREDVLLREIHEMRVALLKKICPSCNNESVFINATSNDDQCSNLDNVENASISSWEAVEDRSVSGPSSSTCTNSSSILQPASNANSVLWVPDHAVSRCTSCHTEFWLGRRKHHCRSCGQIFCADCSEFWAPLPDERLFNPVRLCGPCYHVVTTRIHQQQQQQQFTGTHFTNGSNTFYGSPSHIQAQIHIQPYINQIAPTPPLVMSSYQSNRNIVATSIASQRLPQHQQQNQCATASMKVNASTSPTAAATATN